MTLPLVRISACLVLGIVAGHCVRFSLPLLVGLGLLLCGAVGFVGKRWTARLLPLIVVLVGTANITFHQAALHPSDLRNLFPPDTEQLATIRARVISSREKPTILPDPDVRPRFAVELQVTDRSDDLGGWRPAHGRILASLNYPAAGRLTPGQSIELLGVVTVPPGAFVPGTFDYRAHLAHRGIYFLLTSNQPSDLRPLTLPSQSVISKFRDWATRVLTRHFPKDDESVGLLRAMALGWRTALNEEVAEPFMRSGTMHLFAISGLHVALIAGILIALLQFARVDRKWCGLIAIPLLWFYTATTGWQASAVRSTVMLSVALFGWCLRRPSNLLNTLGTAAFLILMYDPRQLFQPGFQLSFAVVGTMALLLPKWVAWMPAHWFSDPFLPDALRPRWKQQLDAGMRFIVMAAGVSVAAWVGALPLIMYYFNLITPVSLVANLIVVHFGAGALAATMGCLFMAPLVPPASELLANSAWFLMHCMISVSEWFSQVPGGWLHVKSPPLHAVVAYYLLLIVLLAAHRSWSRRTRYVTATGLVLTITAVIWNDKLSQPSITLLPLEGGLAVFAESVDDQSWLIDPGDTRSYEFRTREFLKTRGVNRLDNLILTHGDIRHVGAATNVIHEFKPRRVFVNPLPQRSRSLKGFNALVESTRLKTIPLSAGTTTGSWQILHPAPGDTFSKADDGTLVLLLRGDAASVLLANDLGPEGQQTLVRRHGTFPVDMIVISPNSDARPVHASWLQVFSPSRVIVADSDYPAGNRFPEPERTELANTFSNVTFLSEHGALVINLE